MIKKLLIFNLLMLFCLAPKISYAAPEIDGSCTGTALEPFNINHRAAWQTFTPTRTKLDMIALKIHAQNEPSAKIYMLIWDLTSPDRSRAVYEKIEVVNRDETIRHFYFNDLNLPLGVYGLYLYPIHEQDVIWELSRTSCYAGGSAVYDGAVQQNEDFAIAVYTHNPSTSDEPATEPTPNNPSSSVEPGASQSVNNQTVTPSTSTSSSSNASSGTSTNATNVGSAQVDINDPSIQAMIAELLADAKSHENKGAFGIGGMVGSILTWPVVITAFIIIGLFIIGIIFIIVMANKRSKSSQNKTG